MSGDQQTDIRLLSLAEIESFFQTIGEKPFRAKQVYEWLWKKSCRSFDEMTNLSKETREKLQQKFTFHVVTILKTVTSSDGTVKNMFQLHDGLLVEGVLIPSDDRTTACISCQAGCPLACSFCATGQLGFNRNLTFPEIYDQVVLLNKQSKELFGSSLSNIVYMGMGEPLLNYDQVLRSVEKITSEAGLGISPQRITISSVGIPKMIMKMADDKVKFHFALSLHAANNVKRSSIIPSNRKFPLEELTEALKYYHQKTKKRFTIEYILFHEFNDTIHDARELALFCRSFPVKINLIEYNSTNNSVFQKSQKDKLLAFKEFLETKNLVVNTRKSRGEDIAAACGQLALKEKSL
jgi:23S rRNA (adenine2503-C2)-methyltransferase